MSKKFIIAACFMFAAGLLICSTDSQAMPNFARKYNADCTMCHTQIPKLNKIGYEFRLAGYRLPSEIGKDEKPYNLGDFFAARLQEQWVNQEKKPASGTKSATDSLEFFEFTMYPLTGSWGKYFASITEFSMVPDDVFEVENAFVRGVMGDESGWFQARLGIMHPWEGFGGSDRPIGNTRPLFQKSTAKGSPFFLWNLDESALEVGYHLAKTGTSLAARVSNGIIWKEDGSGAAEPAQGGGLATSKKIGYDQRKNYQVFLNQFITDDSAVSVYYYKGIIIFPDPNTTPAPAAETMDNFDRLAAYANFYVVPKMVNLVAGYMQGKDKLDDSTVAGGSTVGKSNGYFGEVDYHPSSSLAVGLRYDYFKPTDKTLASGTKESTANTLSANYYVMNGLQVIADYQMKEDTLATGGKNKTNTMTARMVFIW